jgi:predicted DNA-binding transcriptional regulator YafY
MPPLDRIQRLLRLVELLQSGRIFNSTQLAEHCGVSRRTVFRDVETLRESGIAVHFDEQRQGYSMPSNMMLPAANFTLPESLSLLVLCHELGDERKGVPFQRAARSAALKLLSNLPHHLREYVAQRTEAIKVRLDPHNDAPSAAPFFEMLTQAIVERRQVRISYRSLTERAEISTALSPYRLLFSRRSWYVIGRSSLHRAVRTFNVARIVKAEMLTTSFTVPPRFSLERYLGNAWHLIRAKQRRQVHIRFRRRVAFNVAEVRWHKTQSVRWLADGSLDFRVSVDGLDEIVWWVLGYGDQAEVIAPRELREMVKAHVASLGRVYGERPPRNGRSPHRKSRPKSPPKKAVRRRRTRPT